MSSRVRFVAERGPGFWGDADVSGYSGKRQGHGAAGKVNFVAPMAGKGEKRFVVVDGQAGTEYDSVAGLVFSREENRLGYMAEKDGKKFVVVGGREGPEYDAIPAGRPSFLADGTVAYLAVKDRVLYSVQHLP